MYEPIAYTYNADVHCTDCAEKAFGRDEHGEITGSDSEDNEVGVISPWDEWYTITDEATYQVLSCSDCGKELDTYSEGGDDDV